MADSELKRALARGRSSEEWVASVARYFDAYDLHYGHGTDNSSDEAYWLIRAKQSWSPAAWAEPPRPDLIDPVVEIARRRATEHRPLAYLLGEAWFAGLRFTVDDRVLIPRSPLAELIERQFQPWCRLQPSDRVLDVGTGSGCLAVATAHHCPLVRVDATDTSDEALTVAKSNVARHDLGGRVRLIRSDLFPVAQGSYRVILSNPPYVSRARLNELPAEYGHEPAEALNGGVNGLDAIDRILGGATEHLAPNGILIVEVGEAEQAFLEAYGAAPVTWLEFERGGDGVFMLTRDELTGYLES